VSRAVKAVAPFRDASTSPRASQKAATGSRLASRALARLRRHSDEDGAFRFTQVLPGSYTIVVDAGNEYETAHEPVNIDRENSVGSMISNVEIMLKPKVASLFHIPFASLQDRSSRRIRNHGIITLKKKGSIEGGTSVLLSRRRSWWVAKLAFR
jgi:hypothetical protein